MDGRQSKNSFQGYNVINNAPTGLVVSNKNLLPFPGHKTCISAKVSKSDITRITIHKTHRFWNYSFASCFWLKNWKHPVQGQCVAVSYPGNPASVKITEIEEKLNSSDIRTWMPKLSPKIQKAPRNLSAKLSETHTRVAGHSQQKENYYTSARVIFKHESFDVSTSTVKKGWHHEFYTE